MKISTLNIYNYKNLNVELNNSSSIIALIGNNGSGKSNILEALSSIFFHLYNKREKDIPFNFKVVYTVGGNQEVSVEKINSTIRFTVNEKNYVDIQQYLPKQIVAIYSGEENRLWTKYYQPVYNTFINNINKSDTSGIGEYSLIPKMLYINKFYWHISLLCLLLSDAKDTKLFCEQILGLNKINSIKFDFNKSNYANYSDSAVKNFFSLIDEKNEYSLSELKEIIDDASYTYDLVFKYLYIAFTPDKKKMLDNITIKYNDENLDIEDFSEGEKKMLLIKAALEFAGMEDSLFLLDEPDAHIHLNNKIQIKNVFNEYLETRQVILTTHSPTLTDTLEEEALFMLTTGKLVPHKKQEILENVSGDFWNKFQQNAFIAAKKPILLLLEGKHDKEHISNAYLALKEEYNDIEFQCFVLNSESKIQPFMSGLYESDFYTDKIYIGVYDSDKVGEQTYNSKSFAKGGDKYRKLAENNGKANNSYFAIVLPKPEGISCECTIETMYEPEKFEEALTTASAQAFGKLKNRSIDDISKGIKEQAKNILAENSKDFNKEDFKNFRNLFDLIAQIKKDHDKQKNQLEANEVINQVVISNAESKEKNDEGIVKDEAAEDHNKTETVKKFISLKGKKSGRSKTESQHLKGKQASVKRMYQSLKNEILKREDTVAIDPKVEYIAFKRDNKNIFDVKIQNLKLIIWVNKKKGDIPTPYNDLFEDCSGKGHHGNGDYERHIKTEDEMAEFIETGIIQMVLSGSYYE